MDARSSDLTAFEHQSLSVGEDVDCDLSTDDAEELARLGIERPGFCVRGHRSLRLAQFVGLVNLRGRMLEVLPKVGATEDGGVCRGTLLRLLGLAHDLKPFSRNEASHELGRGSLLDIFVGLFLSAVLDLARAGFLRRYRTQEEDLGVVRGRFLFHRQVTALSLRPDRIACRFDELSIDNPENQVLKAALLVARPWARGVESGRKWVEAHAALDEVATIGDPLAKHAALANDRQSSHYEVALRWAGWILRLLSPNLRAGGNRASELLFDMNRLFERAVAITLDARARRLGLRIKEQDSERDLAKWNSHGCFRMRPDIVVSDGLGIVAVADTKWTELALHPSGRLIPEDSHLYQLNAYGSVYPCKELALIYPWHAGLSEGTATTYELRSHNGDVKRLHLFCIDVAEDGLPIRHAPSDECFARLAEG